MSVPGWGGAPRGVSWPNAQGRPVATAFQGQTSYPSYGSAGSGWQTPREHVIARAGNQLGVNSAYTPPGPYSRNLRGITAELASTYRRGGRRSLSRSRKQKKSRKQRKSRKGSKGRKTRRSQ